MSKIINIGRNTSAVFLALMIVTLPFASAQPVQAADLPGSSSGYTYTPSSSSGYTYTPSSSSGYTYTPSSNSGYTYTPSSNSGYTYTPGSSSGYTYTPGSNSGYTYTPGSNSGYTYTPPSSGCKYNCGGGGGDGGCKYNCGGGCKYNCGGDNGGCKHNCNPPTPKVPSCTISINPSHVDYDGEATITWSSTNADSASLTDFGSVEKNGSRFLSNITEDATYTLTVKGHGKTVTCSDKVTVEEEEEDDLQCKLRASETRIDRGDSVKISWSSEGAEWGKISPTIGEVDENGSETVRPRETTTYKGTFYNDEGDKVTCSVKVKVDEDVYIPPHTPYITLSAVPYTGFELGPVGTAIYWSLLVLWCLIAAYLIAVKKAHVGIARRINSFLFGSQATVVTVAPAATIVHKTASAHSVHAVHSDTTDEFVLSQLARGRHA